MTDAAVTDKGQCGAGKVYQRDAPGGLSQSVHHSNTDQCKFVPPLTVGENMNVDNGKIVNMTLRHFNSTSGKDSPTTSRNQSAGAKG